MMYIFYINVYITLIFKQNTCVLIFFLVQYYCYSELLVGFSLLVSIYTYNMATKHNSRPAPRALTKLINSKVSVFLMLPKYKVNLFVLYGENNNHKKKIIQNNCICKKEIVRK